VNLPLIRILSHIFKYELFRNVFMGPRFLIGTTAHVVAGEFCWSYTAAARTWGLDLQPLSTGELFAWRMALMSRNEDMPLEGYKVQGVLPFLRYLVGRERSAYQKLESEAAKAAKRKKKKIVMPPNVFRLRKYKAEVTVESTADTSVLGLEPDSYVGWSCEHCQREIANMYFRCSSCYNHKEPKEHLVCHDCFFAGRHFQGPHNQHPSREKEEIHKILPSQDLLAFSLRFRLVHMGSVERVILESCAERLKKSRLPELPKTEDILLYLENHPAIVAIQNQYIK